MLTILEVIGSSIQPPSERYLNECRWIRLREIVPKTRQVLVPSQKVLKMSDCLEAQAFVVETDGNGYIQPSGPSDAAIHLLFLGGSTTDCLFIPPA